MFNYDNTFSVRKRIGVSSRTSFNLSQCVIYFFQGPSIMNLTVGSFTVDLFRLIVGQFSVEFLAAFLRMTSVND
jgi:hypothetical protein